MKKTILCSMVLTICGCTCGPDCSAKIEAKLDNPPGVQTPEVKTVAVPCSYSCVQPEKCSPAPAPVILKPRVTEVISHKDKRNCCDNAPVLPGQEDEVIIPDAPEIYIISANRTVNSMQKEAEAFYANADTLKIFISDAQAKADDLPGGMDKGTQTLKKRFAQMSNVIVTDKKQDADYEVSSAASWYDTATKKIPAIKYDLFLKDKNGKVIGQWSEILHQAEGDRSWW